MVRGRLPGTVGEKGEPSQRPSRGRNQDVELKSVSLCESELQRQRASYGGKQGLKKCLEEGIRTSRARAPLRRSSFLGAKGTSGRERGFKVKNTFEDGIITSKVRAPRERIRTLRGNETIRRNQDLRVMGILRMESRYQEASRGRNQDLEGKGSRRELGPRQREHLEEGIWTFRASVR